MMNEMGVNVEILEEYRESLKDRYTSIELCELFINHFNLSEEDILTIFGDDYVMELKFR